MCSVAVNEFPPDRPVQILLFSVSLQSLRMRSAEMVLQ
jgi:hypothetical protein